MKNCVSLVRNSIYFVFLRNRARNPTRTPVTKGFTAVNPLVKIRAGFRARSRAGFRNAFRA